MPIKMRNEAPPEARGASEERRFPGKLILLALLAMTGLYYHLIYIVPAAGADDSTLPARAVLALGHVAEAHPTAAGAILLALICPAAIFRARARQYLLRLTLILALLWAGIFSVSSHPDAQAAEAVRALLSNTRSFPETIHGR